MKIWLITMTERTDGQTDGGRSVDGRPDEKIHEYGRFTLTAGWLAGWLKLSFQRRGLADGRRTDGRTDGRWTDGGRTPGRKNPGMYENMKI